MTWWTRNDPEYPDISEDEHSGGNDDQGAGAGELEGKADVDADEADDGDIGKNRACPRKINSGGFTIKLPLIAKSSNFLGLKRDGFDLESCKHEECVDMIHGNW